MNDWTGTSQSLFKTLGSSRHTDFERETHDYYATEPKATEWLMKLEKFNPTILEPACGEGHIAKVLEKHGYKVIGQDLISRGYGVGGIDFLTQFPVEQDVDVITNPPYSMARQFVEKSLEIIPDGNRVAMFLKLTFLESEGRKQLFHDHPPEIIYVSVNRLKCGLNGQFGKGSAACYAWFIWRKGFKGEPRIKWFN